MILIFLLILLSVGLGQVEETASSDLQLIANDYRILSRVLNAIYIQIGLTDGFVTPREILLEFIQVPDEVYKSIVNADVTKLRSLIDMIQEEFINRNANNVYESVYEQYYPYKLLIADLENIAGNNINVLEKAGRDSTENIFNEGRNIRSSFIVNNDCLKLNTANLNEFRKIVGKYSCWSEFSRNDYIRDVIHNFTLQNNTLSNCIKNVKKLDHSIHKLNISETLDKYQEVRTVRDTATRFFKFKLDRNIFNEIGGNLTATWQFMEGYTDISPPSFMEAIKHFEKSVKHILALNRHLPRHFTAGFRNIYDLPINETELRDPLFKKLFVSDSYTNGLIPEMQSYNKSTTKIVRVLEVWNSFVQTSGSLLSNGKVKQFARYLNKYWAMNEGVRGMAPHIQNMKLLAENCIQLKYSNEALNKLAEYERQQNAQLVIIRRISKLEDHVSQLRYRLKPVHQIFQHQLSLVSNFNPPREDFDTLIDVYKLQNVLQIWDFVGILKMTAQLAENLQKLKKELESLKRSVTIIKLDEILKMMNLTNAVKCIKKQQFEGGSSIFQWYWKHFKAERDQRINGINLAREYLEGIASIQNHLHKFHEQQPSIERKQLTQNENNTKWKQIAEGIGLATSILEDMEKVRRHQNELLSITNVSNFGQSLLKEFELKEWMNPTERLNILMNDVKDLNLVAGTLRNVHIFNRTAIFLKASAIKGISGSLEDLKYFNDMLKRFELSDAIKDATKFKKLADLDVSLDFARFEKTLKDTTDLIKTAEEFLNVTIFPIKTSYTINDIIRDVVGPLISAISLLVLITLLVYGLTKSGRRKCQNLYLYYFGNWKVFEKRWRYSLFMDTINMKNAILDAVRERNKANLLKALKSGAYINVYNKYGNTALHVATKTGLSDFVDILISYGADRSLLNVRNLTPEEMISPNFNKTQKTSQDASKFEAIQAIYKKHKKKTFRIAVPQVFPVNSFHIWMDEKTDDKLTNAFMEKFPHITSDEPMPTTTHVIFHTDAGGIVEIDRLEQLIWIFHGAIIVKEQWMVDCLNDPKLIKHDSDYLVEKLRFNGVVYDTVLQWTEAMAKGTMPYLCGAYVAAVMKECPYLPVLSEIVTNQGGVMMPSFPVKDDFNIGSHPYLHANLGPLFLIQDGTTDLAQYKSDPDKMYTIFTKNEFIAFLLKRQINQDTRKNPPPVLKDDI